MPELLVLLYAAYLVGLGRAWLGWMVPQRGWSWASLAWSYGLGTILWGYGQFLLNVVNLPVYGMWLYVWQALLVALPFVASKTSFPAVAGRESMGPPPAAVGDDGVGVTVGADGIKWLTILSSVLVAVAFLTAVLQALALPMHMWDSIVIYGFKAKILFLQQTFKTPAFTDPEVIHYSADYPLLIPYLEAGFYRWLGHPDDRVVRLLFAGYWAAWLGILHEALSARLPRAQSRLLLAFVATLPLFSNMYMGQASSGFADIPFALFWTGFLLCPEPLMPLMAVGCVFTKNEGIPLVIIGWGLRRDYRSAVVGLVLLVPWAWARHLFPHNAAHYLRAPDGSVTAPRLRLMGRYMLREIMDIRSWGLFWPLALAGLAWPWRSYRRECKVLLSAVALQLVCYVCVYLMYAQDFELLLPITLPRLLIHMAGPLVVALGWKFEEKKN